MANVEYNLWRLGIPFTNRVTDKLDYDEFSGIRLMPSLAVLVCVLAPLISFNQSSSTFLYIRNTQMKQLCQEGPIGNALIDPPYLPWPVYAYGPDGFSRERPVECNTNVTCYHFLEGTRAVSSLSFLFLFFSILASKHLF